MVYVRDAWQLSRAGKWSVKWVCGGGWGSCGGSGAATSGGGTGTFICPNLHNPLNGQKIGSPCVKASPIKSCPTM